MEGEKKGKARDMQAPTVQRRALLLLIRSECRRRRGGCVALESSIAYVWKRRWFSFLFFAFIISKVCEKNQD